MAIVDQVLQRIDDDLPASLDRLFALLRIESISTDPAYREYAEWMERHGPIPRFLRWLAAKPEPKPIPAE